MAHSAEAQLRAIAAGEIAGAWKRLEDLGAQLTNSANVIAVVAQTNQETALRLMGAQNRLRGRMAGGCRGSKYISPQRQEPKLPRLNRATEDRQRDFQIDSEEGGMDKSSSKQRGQSRKGKWGFSRGRSGEKGSYQCGNSDGNRDYDITRRKRPR